MVHSKTLKSVSLKNVRFAPELTTVKKFDSDSEPISISSSNQSSPEFMPSEAQDLVPEYTLPPILFNLPKHGLKKKGLRYADANNLYVRDDEVEIGIEDDEDDEDEDDYEGLRDMSGEVGDDEDIGPDVDSFDIVDCKIVDTNLVPFTKKYQLNKYKYDQYKDVSTIEKMIMNYLNGNNIKLHSLTRKSNKLHGLLYVNNLNFEKFIELKFSFNGWKDMHYTTATYKKSITERIDEFKFCIDLMALKYILKSKNLIYCESQNREDYTYCHLNMELCCRYDVNNETYYDNNNYKNYKFSLVIVTAPNYILRPQLSKSSSEPSLYKRNVPTQDKPANLKSNFQNDFLTTTTLSHNLNFNNNSYSRRFSDDTDYYNTSPLKHLYHNDTTLIKPARVNEVLGSNSRWNPGNPDYDAGFLETHSYNFINKPITTNYSSAAAYIPNTINEFAFNDELIESSKLKSKILPDTEASNNISFQFLGDSNSKESNENIGKIDERKNMHTNATDISTILNASNYQPDSPSMNGYVTLGEVSDFTSNPNNSSETLVIANSRSQSASNSGLEDSTGTFKGDDEYSQYTADNSSNSNDVSPSETPSSELASILNSGNSQDNSSISEDVDFVSNDNGNDSPIGFANKDEVNDVFNKINNNQLDYQSILNSYCFYEPRRESYNSTCYDGDDCKNNDDVGNSMQTKFVNDKQTHISSDN
ncbi:protein phosphatase regulator PIG1 [Nakaseomyces bracarensis]|uniref:protein phosphatase regulator PIG1 n=1 Tax=Nakaseomyces bracarensis TaxID=273131 RepID=UPI003871580C